MPAPLPLAKHAQPLPTPPAPAQAPQDRPHYRGLSLRPSDAIDPYALHRFAPDQVGINQLGVWCPSCNGSVMITDAVMTDYGLYIEGVCYSCSNPNGDRPGIYKRLRIPLPWGRLPMVEE